MDVGTALNHRRRLQGELDIIRSHGLTLPISTNLLATEIARLDQLTPTASMRSCQDVAKIKIPVENPLLLHQLSLDFELDGRPSMKYFQLSLMNELRTIDNFTLQPLPLTHTFVWRVVHLLAEEIARLKETYKGFAPRTPPPPPPPPPSEGWQKYVARWIDEAIDFVIQNDPEGESLHRVYCHLEANPRIEIDEKVRRLVSKKYFEATFPLKSKPAPTPVLPRRRSQL